MKPQRRDKINFRTYTFAFKTNIDLRKAIHFLADSSIWFAVTPFPEGGEIDLKEGDHEIMHNWEELCEN